MADSGADRSQYDYAQLEQLLLAADASNIYQAVVDTPFNFKAESVFLFLGIVLFVQVDAARHGIVAKAISVTDFVDDIDNMAVMPIDAVFIPMDDQENLIVRVLTSGEAQQTMDWSELLHPVMTAEQARFTQASGGIAFSAVSPVKTADFDGALVYSFFRREGADTAAQDEFIKRYSQLAAQALAKN